MTNCHWLDAKRMEKPNRKVIFVFPVFLNERSVTFDDTENTGYKFFVYYLAGLA
jgi:hypothetical protein